MPYSITTKDGITLRNIPDNVAPDAPELRARIEQIRKGPAGVGYVGPSSLPQSAPPPEFDPTAGMSGPARFAAGMGKAFSDIGRGAGQLAGMVSAEDVERSRQLDAPLMRTPGGFGGAIAGNVAAAAPTVLIPGANTVLGSALTGGAFGALQPTGEDESRLANIVKGGVAAGGITAAARALPAIKTAIVDSVTQSGQKRIVGDLLRRFYGPTIPTIEQSSVPGVQRTLAEAGRTVGAAQLERAAMASSQDVARKLGERQLANNAAMVDALRGIAGSQTDQGLARGVRELMTEPLYREAMTEGIDPAIAAAMQPQIQNLMERIPPAVLREARSIARIKGEQVGPEGSVQGLQYLKLALDNLLDKTQGMQSIGKFKRNALVELKSDLMTTLEELSPKFAQANRNYATYSRPVNQQQIGQALLEKLEPALTREGGVRLTPSTYANAVADAEAIVRQATGLRKPLEDVMTGSQMATIRGIAQDLGRRAYAQEAGKVPGSPTAQYLAGGNALRSIMGPLGLPQGWADSVAAQVLANRWISAALRPAETRMQELLGDVILNPELAQRLAVPPRANALTEAIGRYGLPPIAIGSVNALQQQ